MADLPDPVGPETTVSLPVGNWMERSTSWNGVSGIGSTAVDPLAVGEDGAGCSLPLETGLGSFLDFLSLSLFLSALSSDCFPVFHWRVAFLKPIE